MGKIKKILKMLFYCIVLCIPTLKNTILFCSFYGQFNDNPRYICDEFYKRYKGYKIYWVVSKKKEELPAYVRKVKFATIKYRLLIFLAEIVVDNHFSCRSIDATDSKLDRLYARIFTKKRRRQFVISTWHGTAFKYIGVTAGKSLYTNNDILVLGNNLIKEQILTNYNYNFNIKVLGSPRNDILFNINKEKVDGLKNKLGLPCDKKIVVYAPTFRGESENYGIDIVKSIDFVKILNSLTQKFGGEWRLVIRLHHIALSRLLNNPLEMVLPDTVINGNLGDDMAEYLACADVLISDYSSNIFDFVLTHRPCFLFASDYNKYNEERKFLINADMLPFQLSKTYDELNDNIKSFNRERYLKNINEFMLESGYHEYGTASSKVVDLIEKYKCYGKKWLNEKNK